MDLQAYAEHIIPASPTPFGRWAWETFCSLSINWSFDHVELIREGFAPHPDRSILLVGNHISWWDGFWPIYLNARHIGKKYHVMMLEEQLKPRMFMRKGGAFSIQPGSRSMLHSLNYAADLLQQPDNLVLMFPQGQIRSLYENKMAFAPGVDRLYKKAGAHCDLVFMANFIDFFARPKPTLYTYLQTMPQSIEAGIGTAYQEYFDTCQQQQIARAETEG